MGSFKALLCASLCAAIGGLTSTQALDHQPIRTLRVPGTFPTIQAGIDAAHEGDTVLVAPGKYTGPGNKNLDFGGKDLILMSEAGSVSATIDCELDGRALYFGNGETAAAVVHGFTFCGGSVYSQAGGAICCVSSSPTIANCNIADNRAMDGGGVFCGSGASPMLSGCTITDNCATWGSGGGVQCIDASPVLRNCAIENNESNSDRWDFEGGGGIHAQSSSPRLIDCTIRGNVANLDLISGQGGGLYSQFSSTTMVNCEVLDNRSGGGGGIECAHSMLTLLDCKILNNQADFSGGGLACWSSSTIECVGTTISHNRAGDFGGGFMCGGYPGSTATLVQCSIDANEAVASGGGVYGAEDSHLTLISCALRENRTTWMGGGGIESDFTGELFLIGCMITGNSARHGGGLVVNRHAVLTNCTITGNLASISGGGIRCGYSGRPMIKNCILWGNSPDEIYSNHGGATIRYSDVQGGWPGEGNIDAPPIFRSYRGYDYLLGPNSPCVDAGDPAIYDGVYDSHPRWPDWYPNSSRSDLGAYGGENNAGWLP